MLLPLLAPAPLRADTYHISPLYVTDAEYVITNWQVPHGLPDATITSIVQTADGYLWFGTFHGLVRFDGLTFTVYNILNTPALPSDAVVNVFLDHAGDLWVGTMQGIVRLHQGEWQRFGSAEGWRGNYVRFFAESAAGELYASTFDGVILSFHAGKFQSLPEFDGSKEGCWLWIDPQDHLNVFRAKLWKRWNNGHWETIPSPFLQSRTFAAVAPSQKGRLWILAEDRLLLLAEGRVLAEYPLHHPPQAVWEITEDRDGALWMPTDGHGVYRITPGGDERNFSMATGLPANSVRTVARDREGNHWIGTAGGGLLRFMPRRFLSFGPEQGLPNVPVRSVAPTHDGVFVATWGAGVYRIGPDGKATPFNLGLPEMLTTAILKDQRGRLWLGTRKQGLFLLERGESKWQSVSHAAASSVEALFEDSRGRIWAGIDGNALVNEGNTFREFPIDDRGIEPTLRCFVEDPVSGQIWAGGDHGLYRNEGSRFIEVHDPEGAHLPALSAILPTREGLWLGSITQGVLFWNAATGKVTSFGDRLPISSAAEIIQVGDWVWIPTNRGIYHIRLSELEQAVRDPRRELSFQLFDEADGLPSAECPVWNEPGAAIAPDGRLWFATLKGLAVVDPEKLHLPTNPVPVRFEGLSVAEDALRGDRRNLTLTSNPIIPAGSSDLRFVFNAVRPTAPERILFAYTLKSGGQIALAGRQTDRELRFLRLDPGDYVLAIRARTAEGIWSQEARTLAFSVQPFWYENHLVQAGSALAGLCLLIAAMTWNSRKKLARTVERLRHQTELSDLRNRLALVLENTSDAVIFRTGEGQVSYLNQAALKLLQLPELPPEGSLPAGDLFAPRFAGGPLQQAVEELRTSGVWHGMGALRAADGAEIPAWLSFVTHDSGVTGGGFTSIIARDMTDLVKAEESLRSSEQKFSRAFHVSPDAMAILRLKDLRLVEVNESYHKIFDSTAADPSEATMPNLELWDTPSVKAAFAASLRKGKPVDWQESAFRRRDGVNGTALFAAEPIELEGEACALLLARDITNQKRLEESLRQTQKMESVGLLAGGIAHDFNNQLTVIDGTAHLLLMDSTLAKGTRRRLESIVKASAQAANLTRQLLVFSRKQVIQPRPLDFNTVVRETAQMLRPLIAADIKLDTLLDPTLPPVMADPSQMQQVVMNLALNACDAMRIGGNLRIETRNQPAVSGSSRPGGPWVVLVVSDTGVGMSEEIAARIFEPFFTTKAPGRGTGLGLSTVYGIVHQTNGEIQLESAAGVGTTFSVYLPATTQPPVPVVERPSLRRLRRANKTVLLVEDQEEVRLFAAEVLSSQGYRVLSAESGETALILFDVHAGAVDLLVTDVIMPGINGRYLWEQLAKRQPALRVLYMSGYSDHELGSRGIVPQEVAYLPKPFRADGLLAKVTQVLEG